MNNQRGNIMVFSALGVALLAAATIGVAYITRGTQQDVRSFAAKPIVAPTTTPVATLMSTVVPTTTASATPLSSDDNTKSIESDFGLTHNLIQTIDAESQEVLGIATSL